MDLDNLSLFLLTELTPPQQQLLGLEVLGNTEVWQKGLLEFYRDKNSLFRVQQAMGQRMLVLGSVGTLGFTEMDG